MKHHGVMRKAAGLIGSCLLLTSCGLMPQEAELPKAPIAQTVKEAEYTLTTAMRGSVLVERDLRCTYKPARSESLKFEASGIRVDTMFVEMGTQVQKGDLLGQLEMEDLEIEEERQEADLEKMRLSKEHLEEKHELEARRMNIQIGQAEGSQRTKLWKQKTTMDENYTLDLQQAENDISIQEKRLQETEKKIADRRVYAGISGVVTYVRPYEEGDVSGENETAVMVSDVESSAFMMEGDDCAFFTVGDIIQISYKQDVHEAEVVTAEDLGLKSDPEAQICYFRLVQPDLDLESGTQGSIHWVTEQVDDVIYVRSDAIIRMGGQTSVYYLDADGVKCMKEVETGLDNGTYVEIISGLEEGEEILNG